MFADAFSACYKMITCCGHICVCWFCFVYCLLCCPTPTGPSDVSLGRDPDSLVPPPRAPGVAGPSASRLLGSQTWAQTREPRAVWTTVTCPSDVAPGRDDDHQDRALRWSVWGRPQEWRGDASETRGWLDHVVKIRSSSALEDEFRDVFPSRS